MPGAAPVLEPVVAPAASSGRGPLRRATGGAAGTAAVSGGLLAVLGPGGGDPTSLTALVVATGAVCTVTSWLLARGDRPSVPLHALLGAVAGVLGAVLLGGGDGDALVVALVAGPVGMVGGLLGAAVAHLVPRRGLLPVLVASVLACAGVLVAAEVDQRPPHPGSYLVVDVVPGLDAGVVAELAAARLRTSDDPLTDRAWSDTVAAVLPAPLPEGGRVSVGYAAGEGERRITVDVDGDLACVLVTRGGAQALDGPCARGQADG